MMLPTSYHLITKPKPQLSALRRREELADPLQQLGLHSRARGVSPRVRCLCRRAHRCVRADGAGAAQRKRMVV
jgi:hypothetical protein